MNAAIDLPGRRAVATTPIVAITPATAAILSLPRAAIPIATPSPIASGIPDGRAGRRQRAAATATNTRTPKSRHPAIQGNVNATIRTRTVATGRPIDCRTRCRNVKQAVTWITATNASAAALVHATYGSGQPRNPERPEGERDVLTEFETLPCGQMEAYDPRRIDPDLGWDGIDWPSH